MMEVSLAVESLALVGHPAQPTGVTQAAWLRVCEALCDGEGAPSLATVAPKAEQLLTHVCAELYRCGAREEATEAAQLTPVRALRGVARVALLSLALEHAFTAALVGLWRMTSVGSVNGGAALTPQVALEARAACSELGAFITPT